MVFGIAAMPLVMAATGGIEFMAIRGEQARMQEAADLGALAGASRVAFAGSSSDMIIQAAVSAAQRVMSAQNHGATFTATVDANGIVTVVGEHEHEPHIGILDIGRTTLRVSAVAEGLQKTPLCILQIGSTDMKVDDKAAVQAPGCMVHSNNNLTVADGAILNAGKTQAVGRIKGPIIPEGNSGALKIDDPFANMNLSPPQKCLGGDDDDDEDEGGSGTKATGNDTLTLPPGVHCNEIVVQGNATLRLLPGEHYFEKKLEMKQNTRLVGDDVTLIFGSDDSINFAEKASVEITARKTGRFAGFLLVTGRDNDEKFTIASDNVSELLGTIYIPNAELEIATAGNVAEDSAWSIIVAKTIVLKEDPLLVINTRYAGSGVPVPAGVGPSGGGPRLTR